MIRAVPGGLLVAGPMLWSLLWYMLAVEVAKLWIWLRHAG